jgi:hypothetical protein
MKQLILAQIVLLSAISAFAQGTVHFNNRLSGTSHVYAPYSPGDFNGLQGNGSNDTPPGSINYTGYAPIGLSGTGLGSYSATTTLAMLLGAPGSNAPGIQPPSSIRSSIHLSYRDCVGRRCRFYCDV